MNIRVGAEEQVYSWQEGWGAVEGPVEPGGGWAHHGLAVTANGEIIGFHPSRPELTVFDCEGRVLRRWTVPLEEGHGLTLVEEDGSEYVWIADPGSKMRRMQSGAYQPVTGVAKGQVVKFGMDGSEVMRLSRPEHPAYDAGEFCPTSVAVDEVRHGGSGDVWLADGYGENLVHRYERDGTYVSTLDGEEGAGRFSCPHAVFIDRRRDEAELLVADRGNSRVAVYGLDGTFRRVVGGQFLKSPSAFATVGDKLVVAELHARLAILGPDDQLMCYVGDNGEVCEEPGWPNALDERQNPVRPPNLRPGFFNSPHGLATDVDGNLYVAEWLIGGRMIKLVPALG